MIVIKFLLDHIMQGNIEHVSELNAKHYNFYSGKNTDSVCACRLSVLQMLISKIEQHSFGYQFQVQATHSERSI